MIKAFMISGVVLIFAACGRPTAPADGGGPPAERVLLLSGFNDADTVVVGPRGYRLGFYHDFSDYDTLLFTLRAEQLNPGSQPAHLSILIGPVDYFRDTLLSLQKDVSIKVPCEELAKPHLSAVMFFAADPEGLLRLSNLSVVGWSAYSELTYGQY